MNRFVLCSFSFLFAVLAGNTQVTQINSNQSLQPLYPLTSEKTILVSEVDSTLWVTDGTLAGTIRLSSTIFYKDAEAAVGGRLIFKGATAATGTEIFVTDGTIAGTQLLLDIYPGTNGSVPDADMAVLGNYVYFTASRPAEGRELWRTNGTPGGTTLVKDMVAGPTNANLPDSFNLFSNGTYLLLAVRTVAEGAELWKSDGTEGGTILLKNIYAGPASSSPEAFYRFGNLVLFVATNAANGKEYWKTDGTSGNTTILKDINPGPASSLSSSLFGSFIPIAFNNYYQFNGKVFFSADDGTHAAKFGTPMEPKATPLC